MFCRANTGRKGNLMTGPNIILEPEAMFIFLEAFEGDVKVFGNSLNELAQSLQEAAHLTYAIDFGTLIKKAETEINQVGNAVVAAINAVNIACKDVVNQMVDKFASEGAKSSYNAPPFQTIHLKINTA